MPGACAKQHDQYLARLKKRAFITRSEMQSFFVVCLALAMVSTLACTSSQVPTIPLSRFDRRSLLPPVEDVIHVSNAESPMILKTLDGEEQLKRTVEDPDLTLKLQPSKKRTKDASSSEGKCPNYLPMVDLVAQ